MALMYVSSKLVLFVTIIFHCILFDGTLDAKTLFMSLAMLNNVQQTMTQLMPRVVSLGVESLVSLQRITDFLLTKEFLPSDKLELKRLHNEVVRSPSKPNLISKNEENVCCLNDRTNKSSIQNSNKLIPRQQTDSSKRTVFVECENVGAQWLKSETKTIDGVSFKCESPGLIIICGQVASGKSSLLLSLFNELSLNYGRACVQGVCGYSSQTAWIFNGTVRDNIVFGYGYDERRYQKIVDICALKHDLELLEYGDFTYIQENSLSGGQKARINLARCLYRDCDIYLLDDPFSAIDNRVSKHIFQEAIKNFLATKLVLLATHQVRFLRQCDKILLLDQGKQLAYCNFKELGAKFSKKTGEDSAFSNEQLKRLTFLSKAFEADNLVSTDDSDAFSLKPLPEYSRNNRNNTKASDDLASACAPNCSIKPSENKHERTKAVANKTCSTAGSGAANAKKNSVTGASCACGMSSQFAERPQPGPKCTDMDKDRDQVLLQISGSQDEWSALKSNQTNSAACLCNDLINSQDGKLKNESTSDSIQVPYGSCSAVIAIGEDKTLITKATQATGQSLQRLFVNSSDPASVNCRTTKNASNADKEDQVGRRCSANKVCTVSSRWTMDCKLATSASGLYRTTPTSSQMQQDCCCCCCQKQDEDKTWSKHKTNQDELKEDEHISERRSRNGPADEETSSSKLPGIRVWYNYYTQTSVIRFALIILTFLVTQTLFSTVDIYLTVWSLIGQNKALVNEITGFNQQQSETFKHQAYINGEQQNSSKTNTISYDLATVNAPHALLMSSSFSECNYTGRCGNTNNDGLLEMANEIERGSISPLSSRSSQLPPPSPTFAKLANDFFVPLLNLFYTGNLESPNYPSNISNEQQQKPSHQITTTEGFAFQTALTVDGDVSTNFTLPLVDSNVVEESESALNVKSIYRPLYLFVNSFTSGHHALTYALLLIALFSCSAITNVLSLTSSNKSAISLYKKLTDNALFAKIAFFDQNPAGRFLNRATRDIGIIDEAIPYNANQAYDALLQTAATFVVVAAVDINLALPSLIILFTFLIFHSIHVKPTKDIQRLEGIARSPIISHMSTTLTGLHTIRASKSEHRFEQLFIRYQDAHTSVFLLYLACGRTLAVVLDSLNATYIGIIASWAVVSGLSGPSAGLIITSAMLLSGLTQHGVMKLTETESLMTSVERVIEYCSLPQEENYDRRRGACTGRDEIPPAAIVTATAESYSVVKQSNRVWPTKGSVEYKHVDLYYNRLDKPVLKNISFKLEGGEKVGIIGRTGAGKSSIITTLFRLYDFEGTILVDGLDITKVDLLELRTAFGIIPQNPVLFSTTVRQNLDPLNVYDDFSIWAALDKAHLRQTVSALPGKLNFYIGSGGGFSSGQKQLICLARVLLRQNSVIVMDEATANVDPTTDAIIQTTIRREFKHCTVITIAHRLETILDCNRIMVLEAGRIVDFDTPEHLAAKSNSYFANLLRKSAEE